MGLGWGIDQWYQQKSNPIEDPVLLAYHQLGAELRRMAEFASLTERDLQRWEEQSSLPLQLSRLQVFTIPAELKDSFLAGEPLVLDSGSEISLHFYLPRQDQVLSMDLPKAMGREDAFTLRLLLTLTFYAGVILVILLWSYPLLHRLSMLRNTARRFGSGDLSARIAPGRISYISAIEQEFNRMAQRIEVLLYDNKLLSRALSHDLRTPIARLKFGLGVLEEAELEPKLKRSLDHLNRDLAAMESLVETLLSYARFDEAEIVFNPTPIVLSDFVKELTHLYYPAEVELGSGVCADRWQINADRDYLAMLLNNLIQNALNYGKGRVLVQVLQVADQVELVVEDNGAGIPPAEREHVLKPFYRISHAGVNPGHGMGLAIVDRIAAWHKARLILDNSTTLGGLRVRVQFSAAT